MLYLTSINLVIARNCLNHHRVGRVFFNVETYQRVNDKQNIHAVADSMKAKGYVRQSLYVYSQVEYTEEEIFYAQTYAACIPYKDSKDAILSLSLALLFPPHQNLYCPTALTCPFTAQLNTSEPYS